MGGRHEEIDTSIVRSGDPRGRHSGGRVVDGAADALGRVGDIGPARRDHGDYTDRRWRDGVDRGDIAHRLRHAQTPRQLTRGVRKAERPIALAWLRTPTGALRRRDVAQCGAARSAPFRTHLRA